MGPGAKSLRTDFGREVATERVSDRVETRWWQLKHFSYFSDGLKPPTSESFSIWTLIEFDVIFKDLILRLDKFQNAN